MVCDLCAEERVAGLWLLGDESLQHVLKGQPGATHRLSVKDFAEPPEPVDVLLPAVVAPSLGRRTPALGDQLEHAVDHGVTEPGITKRIYIFLTHCSELVAIQEINAGTKPLIVLYVYSERALIANCSEFIFTTIVGL